MLWFASKIWPRVVSAVPSAQLCIAGSSPPPEIEALRGPGIEVTGAISDEELDSQYERASLVVAPLRYGAGVKGKILEALSHGKPVVTTTAGIQGIVRPREMLDVCDDENDFADIVIEVLGDPVTRLTRALAGLDFIEQTASESAARRILGADIPELLRTQEAPDDRNLS
jgi:glycosyltransferase involved in cell wall biosynthesis